MSEKSKYILYEFGVSSSCWRVRMAFAYKGIAYERRDVEDTETPEFRKINPAQHVPVMEVDGNFIVESMAILEYIEETNPDKPLLPKDPIERAKVREICSIIVSGIQPLQHPLVAAHHSPIKEEQEKWTQYYISKGFAALEEVLAQTCEDGMHCLGSQITFADCCLVPQVYNAVKRFNVDMNPYPIIMKIYEELMKIPAVSSGSPECYKE